jgi:membrane protein DedA with SNARE-associated domain
MRAKGFWRFALWSIALFAALYFLLFVLDLFLHQAWSRETLISNIFEVIFVGLIIAICGWQERKERCGGLAHTLPTENSTHTPEAK